MPLDHSKATVKVSVTGLAIGFYNPSTYNWELALIRQPPHQLRVTVVKFDEAKNRSQMAFDVDDKHNIFITAANAIVPDEPLYKKDPFDRLQPEISDREDFRWIVDLETELNDGNPAAITKPDGVAITELYVSSPVLYADQEDLLDDLDLFNLQTGEQTEFGALSQMCHGDITCNSGGAVVLCIDGPLGFSLDLPQIDGVTHTILIENLCPVGKEGFTTAKGEKRSDFTHYFSVVSLPGGATFDVADPNGGLGSDAVCNPVTVGGTGRVALLPVSD